MKLDAFMHDVRGKNRAKSTNKCKMIPFFCLKLVFHFKINMLIISVFNYFHLIYVVSSTCGKIIKVDPRWRMYISCHMLSFLFYLSTKIFRCIAMYHCISKVSCHEFKTFWLQEVGILPRGLSNQQYPKDDPV